MKLNKKLRLLVPDIKSTNLGSGVKQRAEYIQLPSDFGPELLENDINNGASVFAPCLKANTDKDARYNIIIAPNCEDGFKAVTYIASIHAKNYGNPSLRMPFELSTTDPEFVPNTDGDLFDEINENDSNIGPRYRECMTRVPLVTFNEFRDYYSPRNRNLSYAAFRLENDMPSSQRRPWWQDCTSGPICIYKQLYDCPDTDYYDDDDLVFSDSDLLCLKNLSCNKHVYVLIIDPHVRQDDMSIVSATIKFTANCYNILSKDNSFEEYHYKAMMAIFKKKHFKFSKSVDTQALANKLANVDKEHICQTYENIAAYLEHKDANSMLKATDFDGLGLSKIIKKYEEDKTVDIFESQLFGMDTIKTQLDRILHVMNYNSKRAERGLKVLPYHNVFLFVGAPGTAKTTVAKYFANKMAEAGHIISNRFVAVSGAQLKGAYVGQTAPKVHALFEQYDAIFIDEAYSLASSSDGSIDSYAQEALAQLAIELEEHSHRKLIIFAGYGGKKVTNKNNKMNEFINSNPGIKSRINATLYFDSYNPTSMLDIIANIAKQNELHFDRECDELIKEYFNGRYLLENFGNGREARSFLEQCQLFMATRLAETSSDSLSNKAFSTIIPSDIENAIQSLKEMTEQQTGTTGSLIGF